ncbi:Transcriptional regulator, AcrR family [hydrothermal vent metagenome]|uniref:Transcriptional regulator, AcrR family n=1 Tax=hydrothermal vent metagenome TaxID=652676 RepID=A0A3B1A7T3_9ZZZZ
MASVKRDLLVATALELFTKNGYRATGIDKILAESGVAKMTLYKHFKSKDELIIAALRKRDDDFSADLAKKMQSLLKQQNYDPRIKKLMAFFDALHLWIKSDAFYGCNFINASIEFKREDDPIHVAASAHKKLVIQMIQELLAELHLPDTVYVARSIHMLVEGAIVMAVTIGDKNSALQAKDNAIKILTSYNISPPLMVQQ